MSQLDIFKAQIGTTSDSDAVLNFYLGLASDAICDIRYSDIVEPQYLNVQILMAIDLYNKRGAEGQTSHGENGISRSYESAGISPSLLAMVTPYVRTPFSTRRVITVENS